MREPETPLSEGIDSHGLGGSHGSSTFSFSQSEAKPDFTAILNLTHSIQSVVVRGDRWVSLIFEIKRPAPSTRRPIFLLQRLWRLSSKCGAEEYEQSSACFDREFGKGDLHWGKCEGTRKKKVPIYFWLNIPKYLYHFFFGILAKKIIFFSTFIYYIFSF